MVLETSPAVVTVRKPVSPDELSVGIHHHGWVDDQTHLAFHQILSHIASPLFLGTMPSAVGGLGLLPGRPLSGMDIAVSVRKTVERNVAYEMD